MGTINIGQKLLIENLQDDQWQQKYADPSLLGSMLKECGISFIEVPIKEDTNDESILEIAQVFKDEGLFISLHPHLYEELSPEIFTSKSYPELNRMLSTAQTVGNITGVPVLYVFHGGRANWEPYQVSLPEAKSNVKDFFRWIGDAVNDYYPNIVPLCETQVPYNRSNSANTRLGDTWESCIELVEGTGIGICWDFGHTYRSAQMGKHSLMPNDHFLAQVAHVHAHDTKNIDSVLEDHFPLGDDLAPWREYCATLARHDYNDTILIEVNPDRYPDLQTFLNGTCDNIQKLRFFFEHNL
jgi:sugar phosphate isomerase/epimerase